MVWDMGIFFIAANCFKAFPLDASGAIISRRLGWAQAIAIEAFNFSSTIFFSLAIFCGVPKKIKAKGYTIDRKMGKVSIVGTGMRGHTGIASKMFNALARKKINIEMISTSEIKVSVIVGENDTEKSVRALHSEFGLSGKKVKREK